MRQTVVTAQVLTAWLKSDLGTNQFVNSGTLTFLFFPVRSSEMCGHIRTKRTDVNGRASLSFAGLQLTCEFKTLIKPPRSPRNGLPEPQMTALCSEERPD